MNVSVKIDFMLLVVKIRIVSLIEYFDLRSFHLSRDRDFPTDGNPAGMYARQVCQSKAYLRRCSRKFCVIQQISDASESPVKAQRAV